MVGDTWISGSATTPYAIQTLRATQQRLHEEKGKFQTQSIPANARRAVLEQLEKLEDTVSQIRVVIRRGDRNALAQQIRQLSTEEKAIVSFAKGG